MPPLDDLAPGLWRLTVTRNGLPPTMTAYVLRDGEDTILVDPLVARETDPLLAALDELAALTRLDIERVLVTHGEPVLQNGARELAASLTRPPWRRSSLY